MADEIELPSLVVKTSKSEFRLRCHAAAWSQEYGGKLTKLRRCSRDYPGLLLLSATGPDTAVKSLRATLYQPEIEAEFMLETDQKTERIVKARIAFGDMPAAYGAAVARLAPSVIHLVAVAKIPGLMPNISDDLLWAELAGPRYTTPLLRSWVPWLKAAMIRSGGIVIADGFAATVGILRAERDELDSLVALGVRENSLRMVA